MFNVDLQLYQLDRGRLAKLQEKETNPGKYARRAKEITRLEEKISQLQGLAQVESLLSADIDGAKRKTFLPLNFINFFGETPRRIQIVTQQ